ncbi:MAG: SOS response-associated peptidase [Chromatocurvus sp.]
MCGRFNVSSTPGLGELLRILGVSIEPATALNVAPTESVPLVRAFGDWQLARWWLTPHWSDGPSQKYAMFNARCETLARSRAYREPFARQRGVVPMSSFIEWRQEGDHKQPWRISNANDALAVAALWDIWIPMQGEPLLSCTLVTTEAAPAFRPWHARMPVLLTAQEALRWLDNQHPLAPDDPLFRPALKFDWRLEPVDRRASNARNKRPEDQALIGEMVALRSDDDNDRVPRDSRL